jgi:sugar lactone lactonase YvrE
MKNEIELVVDAKASLGEGPCWDSQNQLLYWVDINNKKVCIYNPNTNDNKEIKLDQQVGAIVLRNSGGAILAMEKGFYSLDLETNTLQHIVDPERHIPENRFNDGKVDPQGRFWAGTMSQSAEEGKGSLYCLHTDVSYEKKVSHLTISNGLAWSPNHQYMYLIDSPTGKVSRFDYDLQTGDISNREVVIKFPEGVGGPDGMTIDEEGMLWIAHWGGARISRWNPDTGKQIDEIAIPALNVTSCTFGGADFNELYITTARADTGEEDLAKYPHAGGVFKIVTDTRGGPSYSFKG